MAYRRKAPAVKNLTPSQQLSKVYNSCAGNLVFQSHNAMALLAQLHKHDRAHYDQFAKSASVQQFVPAWAVQLPSDGEAPVRFTLPLPSHFINADDKASDFEPRAFFLHKSLPKAAAASTAAPAFPRCGLSGSFFAREEVVDNLQAAAADLKFTSPFWIRREHPGLESGYLRLREGSETIVISLTASVIGLGDVEALEPARLHPSLRDAVKRDAGSADGLCVSEDVPRGTNALTGAATKNPFVCALPNRGLWLSQDQLLQHNIKLSPRITQVVGAFTLVEVDQWELYNADQLQVPGRLGLRQSLNRASGESIFQAM
ncbi:hypothetical protein NESM_000781800 [Novymonas esmeraldas]|uniref:Trypanosoma Tc-38 (p38) protein domain-containing protein n=1 Tax=Novymonas esmeraldas TaxID=1808958 RepID=A0AAW0EVV6_9TRYP